MASQNLQSVDTIKVETVSATEPQQEQAHNPWPHLDEYFLIKSREGDKLIFNCNMCLPKTVPIKAHTTSLNNLKQHIKRTHPTKFMQFEMKIKIGSFRGKIKKRFSSDSNSSKCSSELSSPYSPPSGKKVRQQIIAESFDITATGSDIPQAAVDQKIVNLFVANMLPLHIVESDTFKRLIKTLNPSKSSMSRRTLGRQIINLHTDLKQYLIRVLGDVQWVATTADCWFAHKKGYLGMTVHWLDPITRQRQQAVLACIRLTGHHSYDVLAQAMVKVHYEFHIEKKVTRTTIGNGCNFVKAFVQFGEEANTLPGPPVAQDVDIGPDDAAKATLLAESVDEHELEYTSLEDFVVMPVAEPDDVDTVVGNPINLPVHMKCAAHTFNLVASKDTDAALQSAEFKGPYRVAMAKARALWNQQESSIMAADSIYAEVGRMLVVPNMTRWNSTYDSVVDLNTILETKRPVLHRVMTQLKVNNFDNQDVDFMNEYAKVINLSI
ncbi:uncharacterized protein LOC106874908 isoform X2 [Octopus bimaculoides]|uniref:BED-type domain-containing protein n=2 Tax=Octopus bimaculoides TaxID=37653 RepID=A0A0L8GSZ4_OCTBM|nr:uncharacterized protein LOC106874908 isoform X2 [Octopus bimaculoides]XP_014778310.1 uncharacterized protein LOC106874908 isoform X2 [Octopus bimaculoides]XP_014778311.1 uncharacterized protein LOC106874908 isoform X2 [Octopus bimaculoides]XP_014778312.1 uncharacterized protein LOC106874908 isoform X2 [Octopus bimaculoides]XP_052833626.1 uncharacterized protein LOC106874908 isoform X2 [Octopus bimaculoides]|eukprot:XP_014778309.1 PREDICTED: uncharacterized protein LOC106874908 isoform X2 [Octopus bimaculoides]